MTKKKAEKNLFKDWIQNFALVLSIMYALVIVPYSIMKGLFPAYLYIIFIMLIGIYAIWWGREHRIGKTATAF